MNKKNILTKDNVVNFPSKLTDAEREIEAIIFAAAEPLDIDTIDSKLSKKTDTLKALEKYKKNIAIEVLILFVFKQMVLQNITKFIKSYVSRKTVEKNCLELQLRR